MKKTASRKFVCDLEVVIEEPKRSPIKGRMYDLSAAGLSLFTQRPIATRTEVGLGLRLVLEWAESDTLPVAGRVLWCTPVGEDFQIGVAFNQMAVSQWQRLAVLLRFLRGELSLEGSKLSGRR